MNSQSASAFPDPLSATHHLHAHTTAQKVMLRRATVSSPVSIVLDPSEYWSRQLAPAAAGLSPEGDSWDLRKGDPPKGALEGPVLPTAQLKRSLGQTTAHHPGGVAGCCALSESSGIQTLGGFLLCPLQRPPADAHGAARGGIGWVKTGGAERARSLKERAVVTALIEELVEALEQPTSHAAPQRTPQLQRRFCGRLLRNSPARHVMGDVFCRR